MKNGTKKFPKGTELTFKTSSTIEHSLNQTWSIWEHRDVRFNKASFSEEQKKKLWDSATFRLCDFSTVEGFWKYFNAIPEPARIFTNPETKKKPKLKRANGLQLNAFSVFKEGVIPAWESKEVGGIFQIKKHFNEATLNGLWESLVLGCIGESFDAGDNIVGCRVVDKSTDARAMYRLEVWVRGADPSEAGLKKVVDLVTQCINAITKRHNGNQPLKTDLTLDFQACN